MKSPTKNVAHFLRGPMLRGDEFFMRYDGTQNTGARVALFIVRWIIL